MRWLSAFKSRVFGLRLPWPRRTASRRASAVVTTAPVPHLQGFEQEAIAQRRRRIVLATNVAETSLTVPGIRYVVDSGLAPPLDDKKRPGSYLLCWRGKKDCRRIFADSLLHTTAAPRH